MPGLSIEIDDATGLPLLRKRLYDRRYLTYNVSGKLASGATLNGVTSVTSVSLGRVTGSVSIDISEIDFVDNEIKFLVGGGTQGEAYQVTCWYTSDLGEQLESLMVISVD